MNLLEHMGKRLLAQAEIPTPRGKVVTDAEGAKLLASKFGGTVVLKSQIPSGKRGKAGAIAFASDPGDAHREAVRLLDMRVAGYSVSELLVEEGVDIAREFYLAVLNDASSKGPLMLFSDAGGMDIEEVNATSPHRVRTATINIRHGLTAEQAEALTSDLDLSPAVRGTLKDLFFRVYDLYRSKDAELIEINPLALTTYGTLLALDAKVTLDPGALNRHEDLQEQFADTQRNEGTELERRAKELDLQFIELDGDVGVLANGAGLTMTTLDAINVLGGKPANFAEIGGDAYTKAVPALRLVLDNPNVRSLLVNFCGAFARTDVMTGGVITAIKELRPTVPIYFTIHGTGEVEAVRMLRDELGIEPYERMDDAVRAAVAATGRTQDRGEVSA